MRLWIESPRPRSVRFDACTGANFAAAQRLVRCSASEPVRPAAMARLGALMCVPATGSLTKADQTGILDGVKLRRLDADSDSVWRRSWKRGKHQVLSRFTLCVRRACCAQHILSRPTSEPHCASYTRRSSLRGLRPSLCGRRQGPWDYDHCR
jgi:hypothetical protein